MYSNTVLANNESSFLLSRVCLSEGGSYLIPTKCLGESGLKPAFAVISIIVFYKYTNSLSGNKLEKIQIYGIP